MYKPDLTRPMGRLLAALGLGLAVFVGVYAVWGLSQSAQRYARAEAQAESQAHTILGREGYEYIFEPNTWVLLDKIRPQKWAIIGYVFRRDYLPFQEQAECAYPDQEVCRWVFLNIFYNHAQAADRVRALRYAALGALLAARGAYLLFKPIRRTVTDTEEVET